MAIQDKDDIGEGEEDPIEVRILDCLSRIESINEQLQTPEVMARSKRMDREDLAGWIHRARDAKQHTVEELVRLRYLLRMEDQGKDREIDELRKTNYRLTLRLDEMEKELQVLRSKLGELGNLEVSDQTIDELVKTNWGHLAISRKNQKLREEVTKLNAVLSKSKQDKDPMEVLEEGSRKESESLLRETIKDLRQQLQDLAKDRDRWVARASGATEEEAELTKKTYLHKLWDQKLTAERAILVPSWSRPFLEEAMTQVSADHRAAWNEHQLVHGHPPARTYTPPKKEEPT